MRIFVTRGQIIYVFMSTCMGGRPLKLSNQGMPCYNVICADVVFNRQILNPWCIVIVFTSYQFRKLRNVETCEKFLRYSPDMLDLWILSESVNFPTSFSRQIISVTNSLIFFQISVSFPHHIFMINWSYIIAELSQNLWIEFPHDFHDK